MLGLSNHKSHSKRDEFYYKKTLTPPHYSKNSQGRTSALIRQIHEPPAEAEESKPRISEICRTEFSYFSKITLHGWTSLEDLEKELEALLWICFSLRYLFYIFVEKNIFSDFFSSKNFSIKKFRFLIFLLNVSLIFCTNNFFSLT